MRACVCVCVRVRVCVCVCVCSGVKTSSSKKRSQSARLMRCCVIVQESAVLDLCFNIQLLTILSKNLNSPRCMFFTELNLASIVRNHL